MYKTNRVYIVKRINNKYEQLDLSINRNIRCTVS